MGADGRRTAPARLPDRVPPFVGRHGELAVLRTALDTVASGEGHVVAVEGEPGIGKSRLLAELVDDATSRGFDVACGASDDLEQDRPFGLLHDAMGVELTGPTPAGVDAPERTDAAFVVIEHLLDDLERRAAAAPVLLALDDLQWADPASLRALRAVVRRRAHLGVLCYLSFRPLPRPAELALLVEEAVAGRASVLRVDGLASDDLKALVADELGRAPADDVLDHLGRAGGNPFYAIELARCIAADGGTAVSGAVVDVPNDVRLAVLRRISVLSRATLDLLKVASVLGSRFTAHDLAAVARRPLPDLLPLLEEAIAGLVVRDAGAQLAFRHDLIRDSLYGEVPPSVRAAMHRDTASALIESGAPPERAAPHLVMGAERGDQAAVTWLRAAADRATLRSFPVAAELLRHAHSLTTRGDEQRADTSLELAKALVRGGQPAEADAVIDTAIAEGGDEVVLRLTRMAAALYLGRSQDAVAECETILGLASATDQQRAEVQALAAVHSVLSGDLHSGRAYTAPAVAAAEALDDPYAMVNALQARALLNHVQGRAARAVADAERSMSIATATPTQRTGFVTPFFVGGLVLMDADRLDDARRAFGEGRARAEAAGFTTWLPMFHWAQSAAHFLAGELDDADTQAETSISIAEEMPRDLPMPAPAHVLRALVALYRDLLAEAADAVATAQRALGSSGAPLGIDLAFWVDALRLEATGDIAGAGEAVATAWALLDPMPHLLTRRIIAPDAVRLLRDTDRDRAAAVVQNIEDLQRLAPGIPSVDATLLRCRGLLEGDAELLEAAACALAKTPLVVDAALAREEAALALARVGRRERAVELLELSLKTWEQIGADRMVTRSYAALRAVGVRRRRASPPSAARTGWDSLSVTERKVVALVADGLSNREVGERLYISRRTVETHLSHVFAKLGVSSRASVAAAAAAAARRSES